MEEGSRDFPFVITKWENVYLFDSKTLYFIKLVPVTYPVENVSWSVEEPER